MTKNTSFNTLTYAEKLIASGMDPTLANIYAGIWPKLASFKFDIENNLFDPIERTKNIVCDISIFTADLRLADEKQEIVNFHSKVLNDLIICLIIQKYGLPSTYRNKIIKLIDINHETTTQ